MEFFQNTYNWIIQPNKITWYLGDSELPQIRPSNFKSQTIFSGNKVVKNTPHVYIQKKLRR